MKNKKGFTLVELVVVISTLLILVLIATPLLKGHIVEAKMAQICNDVKVTEGLLEAYQMKENKMPTGEVVDNTDIDRSKVGDRLYDINGQVKKEALLAGGTFIKLIDTGRSKLPGTFIGNSEGKVYYMHDKAINVSDNREKAGIVVQVSNSSEFIHALIKLKVDIENIPNSAKCDVVYKLSGGEESNTSIFDLGTWSTESIFFNPQTITDKVTIRIYDADEKLLHIFTDVVLENPMIPKDIETIIKENEDNSIFTFTYNEEKLEAVITGFKAGKEKPDIIIPHIKIKDGKEYRVTSIGYRAFRYKELTSVVIPNSIVNIEDYAFFTNKLTLIGIPNSVTSIGMSAFDRNELISLEIPDSVVSIGKMAFSDNKLVSILLPSSIKIIEEGVFNNNQLTMVDIPNSVEIIEMHAFSHNRITTLEIPKSVISIELFAFYNNQLTTLEIPSNVSNIGDYAFQYNCITSVRIKNTEGSVTLGIAVFTMNGLDGESIIVPIYQPN